jgi:hypothetical protein
MSDWLASELVDIIDPRLFSGLRTVVYYYLASLVVKFISTMLNSIISSVLFDVFHCSYLKRPLFAFSLRFKSSVFVKESHPRK